ncbi:MAG: gliding motility-associated C-terminal domain-containing protein, partial [Bacteroidota bacterium]
GVDTIRVKMWGGAGGGGPDQSNCAGGGGGFTQATIAVTPGQVLDIYVGGGGGAAVQNTGGVGAWPNGGAGGVGNRNEVIVGDVGGAGGGGGRSQIDIGGVIYAIAGAGGGASLSRNGGGGGGLIAEFTTATNPFNVFGFGGTQTAGGAPSSNTICPHPVSGVAGSFLQGGDGASDIGGTLNDRTGGGGGGDGYYGGGGGGSHDGCFGVGSTGGGGSGYICTTCPGVTGSTQTAAFAGPPANPTDPVLSSFPGTATGVNNTNGGDGLVYICYDSVSCTPSSSGFLITACGSYLAPNGALLTIGGLYIITIPNAAGCDSLISILLTVNNTVIAPPLNISSCTDYTAPWGTTYTQSGTYTDTLTTIGGCDSIVSVNLTITGAILTPPLTATACSSYTAPWGTTYTQSGTYSDTLTTVSGCDSIVSVNLTITGTIITSPITASACSSYTAPWGTPYTQSGTYSDTLTTSSGCDSVVTLNLVIFGNATPSVVNASACDSYTAPWGSVYTQSGSYDTTFLTVNGCDSTVTLDLTISDSPTLQAVTSPDTCWSGVGTASVAALGGVGPFVYAWSNGAAANFQSGLSGGIYTVTVTDQNGCSTDLQLIVPDIPAPILIVSPASATIVEGDTIQLTASGALSYQWSPASGLSCANCESPQAAPAFTTTYTVTGTDQNGCTAQETVTVRVDLDCNEVFVPSIFSPNGTGPEANEQVCVFGKCILEIDFAIYDRWGQLIFQTNDPQGCWDGRKDGKEVMTGVYAYRLFVRQLDGKEIRKSGNVTLTR